MIALAILLSSAQAFVYPRPEPSPYRPTLGPYIVDKPSHITFAGNAWMGPSNQVEGFIGSHRVDTVGEERYDLVISGMSGGKLTELLTVKWNGDILLRGKKVGHDKTLRDLVRRNSFFRGPR